MLTERELEVLLRRASGESQPDIAKALKITQGAVSQFEKNAHAKLASATETLEFLQLKGVRVKDRPIGKKVVYGEKK
jgi:transcriptional regulator